MGLDFGRAMSRSYTPARLASTMWNHAPVMWGAMESAGIRRPKLTPGDAADLFDDSDLFRPSTAFQHYGSRGAGVLHPIDFTVRRDDPTLTLLFDKADAEITGKAVEGWTLGRRESERLMELANKELRVVHALGLPRNGQ